VALARLSKLGVVLSRIQPPPLPSPTGGRVQKSRRRDSGIPGRQRDDSYGDEGTALRGKGARVPAGLIVGPGGLWGGDVAFHTLGARVSLLCALLSRSTNTKQQLGMQKSVFGRSAFFFDLATRHSVGSETIWEAPGWRFQGRTGGG